MPAVVLISGRGSNLQSLIDATRAGSLPLDLRAAISNQPGAYGLERARQAGMTGHCIDHREFPDRDQFDAALARQIDEYRPQLVLLAGFMRILTPAFVEHYYGRMLNIHPSLLPEFPGLHTHERALQSGVKHHGASIHFVTNELDGGPLIVQARVAVLPTDNADSLAQRVLQQEHRLYPLAAAWFATGRLQLRNNLAWLDDEPLHEPLVLDRDPL